MSSQPSRAELLTPEAWQEASQLADFAGLIDQLHRWGAEAPAWQPYVRARGLIERFEPELRKIQLRSDGVLVVGFIGGTGVGKSTLINALVGECVCRASNQQRPTTTRPEIVCAPNVDVEFLGFPEEQIIVHRRDLPLLKNMLLIDCPDPDTQEQAGSDDANRNRDIMRRVLPHCDVMVLVATGQKYRSQIVTEELLRHAPGRCTVFVQSHADREEDTRRHWQQTLAAVGFEVPRIFRLDSEAAINAHAQHQPAEDEFQQFATLLQHQLASRARHRIQRANVLGLCGWLISRIREFIDDATPKLLELERSIAAEQLSLQQAIRTRLAQHLSGAGNLWRAKLLEQVYAKWGWGLLASFFRLLNGLTGLLVWIPLARARTITQLTVAGAVAAAGTAKTLVDQYRDERSLNPTGSELGISAVDVAQARSVLEGYAIAAQLDAGIETQRGARRDRFTQQTLDDLAARLQRRLDDAVVEETRRRVAQRAGKVHWLMELVFVMLPAYLVGRLGYNFFYEHLWLQKPLMDWNFILYGAAWVVVIGWLLRSGLLMILSAGLKRRLMHVVDQIVADNLMIGLAADMTAVVDQIRVHDQRLLRVQADLAGFQRELGKLSDLNVGLMVPQRASEVAASS